MLGEAQISKGKKRMKKPPASSRPLVYETREGVELGKAPSPFRIPTSLSICLKVTGRYFRGKHGSEPDLPQKPFSHMLLLICHRYLAKPQGFLRAGELEGRDLIPVTIDGLEVS